MIWLTWQQHRFMVVVGGLILVLLVPFLIMTGLDVSQAARAAIACVPPPDDPNDCLRTFDTLVQESPVPLVLSSLPLLVGAFIGAPLISRELEQGTYLLAWTQGVPRRRWLLAKLAMLGGLSVLGFAALAGLMAWWSAPVDPLVGPWLTFDARGLVPFAYAFFALALGVAAGAIVRQTVGAMAATAGIFVAVRLAVAQLRPYFLPPLSYQPPNGPSPTWGACWCRRDLINPGTFCFCISRLIGSGPSRGSKPASSSRWPWRCSCSPCGGCGSALPDGHRTSVSLARSTSRVQSRPQMD
jgi:hypothetical protein